MRKGQRFSTISIGDNEVLLISEFHTVNTTKGKEKIIYNVNTRDIVQPDQIGLDILLFAKKNKNNFTKKIALDNFSPKYDKKDIEETINELTSLALIHKASTAEKSPDWSKRKAPKNFSPHNICLNITHKCNLRCIYCYGDGGSFGSKDADMPFEVAKKAVDWQIKNMLENEIKQGSLTFFGGEPLCNFNIIEPIVEYANQKSKENNIKITFTMTSNGALMTEEIAKKLVQLNIHVMFSLDGPPEIQDKQRPTVNGQPSFNECVRGARIYSKTANQGISARATVLSYDFLGITKSLMQAGFRSSYLNIASGPLGEHFMTKEGNKKLLLAYADLFNFFANIQPASEILRLSKGNILIKTLLSIYNKKPTPWQCGGGRSYAAISPSGSIYLCHRFVGDEKYSLGNLNDGKINNALYKEIVTNGGARKGRCAKCWARMQCAGGCYQMNLAFNGDIYKQNAFECSTTKKIIELGIVLYHKLYNENHDLLKKLCCGDELIEHKE